MELISSQQPTPDQLRRFGEALARAIAPIYEAEERKRGKEEQGDDPR